MTTELRATLIPPEPTRFRTILAISLRAAVLFAGAPHVVLRAIQRWSSRRRRSTPPPAPSLLDLPRTPSFVDAVMAALRARQTARLPEPGGGDRVTAIGVKRAG